MKENGRKLFQYALGPLGCILRGDLKGCASTFYRGKMEIFLANPRTIKIMGDYYLTEVGGIYTIDPSDKITKILTSENRSEKSIERTDNLYKYYFVNKTFKGNSHNLVSIVIPPDYPQDYEIILRDVLSKDFRGRKEIPITSGLV